MMKMHDEIASLGPELAFLSESPLSALQTASILEAGLTYILYQRGQLPLPFQQLQASVKHFQTLVTNGQPRRSEIVNLGSGTSLNSENVDLNPRQRILLLSQERRQRQRLQRIEKDRRLALEAESKAYNAIQPALEIVRDMLMDVIRENSTVGGDQFSVMLVLGPSIYCPKEIFYFDFPLLFFAKESTIPSDATTDECTTTILRQFYKKIITSADLMDFTQKPLSKTYAHICVLSNGTLSSIMTNDRYSNVARLPSIPPAIRIAMNSGEQKCVVETEINKYHPGTLARQVRKKCFKIIIKGCVSNHDSTSLISSSNNSLFDNNSFSCYQIPLRFKGYQCKNKRF